MPTSLVTPSPKRMLLAATCCGALNGSLIVAGARERLCRTSGERQHLTRAHRNASRAAPLLAHRARAISRDDVRRTSNAYSFSTTLLPIRLRPVRSDC